MDSFAKEKKRRRNPGVSPERSAATSTNNWVTERASNHRNLQAEDGKSKHNMESTTEPASEIMEES